MYNGYTGRLSDGKRNNAHCSRDLRLDNQSIHLLWIVQLYPSVMCAQESGWWLSSRDWYNLKMAPTLYAYGAHMIVVWHFLRLLKFEKWKIIKKRENLKINKMLISPSPLCTQHVEIFQLNNCWIRKSWFSSQNINPPTKKRKTISIVFFRLVWKVWSFQKSS